MSIVGIFLIGLVLGVVLVPVLVILALVVGVIANKASEPPYLDYGTYTLEQGREIREEQLETRRLDRLIQGR